jgi:hypothetical protein
LAAEYLGIITEPADHLVGRFPVKGLPAVTEEDDRAELRVELGRALSAVTYPCGRAELLEQLRDNGTDDEVVSQLAVLPDRVYEGPDEALMFAEDSQRYESGDSLT